MSETATVQKPKMGRPTILGDKGTVITAVRLSPEQNKIVIKAAKKNKMRKSEWIRQALLEAAEV